MSKLSCPFDPQSVEQQLVDEFKQLTGVGKFDVAVVLGSGWKNVPEIGTLLGAVDYKDWACFPAGQIVGQGGQLLAVKYSSCQVLFFSGRFHCYQGLTAYQAALPVRLAQALGCTKVLLTCAVGGINPRFHPGDFMCVDDHLNFLGDNPLKGLAGDIFVDMSGAYDSRLYDDLIKRNSLYAIYRGILAAMPGPSYETPAEIRFLKNAGADVVSMSTVPEAIMARSLKMDVAAVAFVANYAAGISDSPLTHQDVLACSRRHANSFPDLTKHVLDLWRQIDAGNAD